MVSSSSSTSSSSSRVGLCNQSSFCAETTMVTIVPAFHYDGSFELLSGTHKANVGPFVAGMPSNVPLWIAKTLFSRNMAQIELPEWLSVPFLTGILKEERESTLLSRKLPFYYYEIARALDCCLLDSKYPMGRAIKVVLQDLVAVRSDKLRMHFHELSRSDLIHPPAGYDELDEEGNYAQQYDKENPPSELPIISVTGICSYELNKTGPFLQRAFSDYGFLTRRPSMEENNSRTSNNKDSSSSINKEGDIENSGTSGDPEDKGLSKNRRGPLGRSRLRRFRN